MKYIKSVLFAAALIMSANAFAVDYTMTCEEVITKLNREATEEAKARFANLRGSCLGVVERDGQLFMHTKVVVRRVSGNRVTLFVPATDRTFDVETQPDQRITIAGDRVRPRNLLRGQELNIYVSVDQFTQPVIQEVAFESEATEEVLVPAPAKVAEALPTTG